MKYDYQLDSHAVWDYGTPLMKYALQQESESVSA